MEIRISLPGRAVWIAVVVALVGAGWWWNARHERAAKAALAEVLYHPDAAQVSGVFVGTAPSKALCGFVRAQNGFGAYLGERAFFVAPAESGDKLGVRIIDGDYRSDPGWRAFCDQGS